MSSYSYNIFYSDSRFATGETLEDVWRDFHLNGEDQGLFGDFDRLLMDSVFDTVIARPVPVPSVQRRLVCVRVPVECKFCRNNKKPKSVYSTHSFKDARGNCACPFLRQYKCPTCGATGDNAHTIKYCPKKKVYTEEETVQMHHLKRRNEV